MKENGQRIDVKSRKKALKPEHRIRSVRKRETGACARTVVQMGGGRTKMAYYFAGKLSAIQIKSVAVSDRE